MIFVIAVANVEPSTRTFKPFREMIDERRAEAKRSLCVQVRSKNSAEDLYTYCSTQFGKVRSMHFHQNHQSATFSVTDFPLLTRVL